MTLLGVMPVPVRNRRKNVRRRTSRPFMMQPGKQLLGPDTKGMGAMSDKRGKWAVAVFRNRTESSGSQPGAKTKALAIFGDSILDVRQMTAGEEVSVRAVAIFGSVRVMVPTSSRVEMPGFSLFGSRRNEVGQEGAADGPLVKLRAWALFGDVAVV